MTKESIIEKWQLLYIYKHISCKQASYNYQEEQALNPAYEDISNNSTNLPIGAKRIWALRGDFILATGIKNSYAQEFSYNGMREAFSPHQYKYINWQDRYGHPSLTLAENSSVGAYYAGYLSLEENQINVFLASGRYHRQDLSLKSTTILELYIAHKLQKAYGNKKVIFYHGIKPYENYSSQKEYYDHLGLFFKSPSQLKQEPQRIYPNNVQMRGLVCSNSRL